MFSLNEEIRRISLYMKSKTTDQLYDNLRRKGINVKRGDKKYFTSYSYYQVINAYKPLFVKKVLTIEQIKNDILSNYNVDLFLRIFNKEHLKGKPLIDVYHEICIRIAEKYIETPKKKSIMELEQVIKDRKYLLHIYDSNTEYQDFIRMYKFEHELRNILLRYVLRIEEDIKAIFCSTLNDIPVNVNYLIDISNYPVSNDNSVKSLIKILQKYNNKHSNPIMRKKTQNTIPPFWILINELSLGELTRTIRSINTDVKNIILDKLVKNFTNINAPTTKDRKAILNLILDISVFRNDLAHNNPIFLYNVSGYCLANFPNIEYSKPKDKNDTVIIVNRKKKQILEDLKRFWGTDIYNSVSEAKFNINLSYMIYLISRITTKIDPNTNYKNNVSRVYSKYKIIDLGNWGTTSNYDAIIKKKNIDIDIIKRLQTLLESKVNQLSKTQLRNQVSSIKTEILSIKAILKGSGDLLNITPDLRFEDEFPNLIKYSQYTGIDSNFMQNIL